MQSISGRITIIIFKEEKIHCLKFEQLISVGEDPGSFITLMFGKATLVLTL
jgi:hypothetical protein